jgi:hypothetical protein
VKEYIVKADCAYINGIQELIRCKDCKHYDGNGTCMKNGIALLTEQWFCADGERCDKNDG